MPQRPYFAGFNAGLTCDSEREDESEVDASTALGTTLQWDSLAHMRLILALEERLGRRLDPE